MMGVLKCSKYSLYDDETEWRENQVKMLTIALGKYYLFFLKRAHISVILIVVPLKFQ